jgi:hypothetical protein
VSDKNISSLSQSFFWVKANPQQFRSVRKCPTDVDNAKLDPKITMEEFCFHLKQGTMTDVPN